MTEYVYVAEKRERGREQQQAAHESQSDAREWLRKQIEYDPMMDTFEWEQYRCTVADPDNEDHAIYGTIRKGPWVSELEDPLGEHKNERGNQPITV